MTGFVDRQRAARLMQEARIDALVLCAPEAFHYVTGASMGPAGLFRRAGAGFVVVPAREDLPLGVVVADFNAAQLQQQAAPDALILSHPIWIETATLDPSSSGQALPERIEAAFAASGRPSDFSRPATFDLTRSVEPLKQILGEFGLGR
ncbi:aminopeptidase P family N-terminal domain-containing protein, partial [Mesorhizobium sp.]|uniref:aminopeptidase P family N-terminal domain-containing protein n=1 Tax=Mesorhizobium sp. TaxID=1871066 RepID=UPI003562CE61